MAESLLFDLPGILLVAFIFLAGGLVHGALGFGFPLTAMPLLALITDVRTAMLIILLPSLSVNLISMAAEGKPNVEVIRFWPLALWGALGSLAGTRLLVLSDPAPFKLLLALVIMAYLFLQQRGISMGWIPKHPWFGMLLFGGLGGFLAGTVNVMLPALIVFALEMGLSTAAVVQIFNFCFFTGKLAQGLVFALSGLLSPGLVLGGLGLVLVALAGLFLGRSIRKYINEERYRQILKTILFLLSVILVVQFGLSFV